MSHDALSMTALVGLCGTGPDILLAVYI